MSGRTRMALCAAAATLMASCALLPLVSPVTWLLQAIFLLAIQTGVGMATRRVPLARPLTVAAQALVTLLMLTLVFARAQAFAGIVPGPEAFQHFADLLQQGSDDVSRYAPGRVVRRSPSPGRCVAPRRRPGPTGRAGPGPRTAAASDSPWRRPGTTASPRRRRTARPPRSTAPAGAARRALRCGTLPRGCPPRVR